MTGMSASLLAVEKTAALCTNGRYRTASILARTVAAADIILVGRARALGNHQQSLIERGKESLQIAEKPLVENVPAHDALGETEWARIGVPAYDRSAHHRPPFRLAAGGCALCAARNRWRRPTLIRVQARRAAASRASLHSTLGAPARARWRLENRHSQIRRGRNAAVVMAPLRLADWRKVACSPERRASNISLSIARVLRTPPDRRPLSLEATADRRCHRCAFRRIRSGVPTTSGQQFRNIRSPRDDAAKRWILMSPRMSGVKRFEPCDAGAARDAVRAP